MSFKLWLENNIFSIPIASLIMTKSELAEAVSNIARGYPAATEGPLEVAVFPNSDRYQLVNGYHRMVEIMLRGKTSVYVEVTQNADWNLPTKRDRFQFEPDKPYKGLERFVEVYLLKRL